MILDVEQIRRRTLGPLPLGEWGPKCNGCGADEYRIDGYCSVECRDYHDDDDVRDLLAEIERLQAPRPPQFGSARSALAARLVEQGRA